MVSRAAQLLVAWRLPSAAGEHTVLARADAVFVCAELVLRPCLRIQYRCVIVSQCVCVCAHMLSVRSHVVFACAQMYGVILRE